MASSASPIAMFELMGTGENGSTWGAKANVVFQVLERFSNGVLSVTMNAATKTLTTATDYSARDWHYAVFNLVSATQAANFVLPSKQKFFGVKNSATGAYTATVKTATGTGVAVRQGETAVLYNNGTDVVKLLRSLDFAADPGGNGLVARTAAGSASARTITAPAAGITVSNGDGVSGNPTLALANDLAALEGLASTGIAVRTGSDAWAQRTVTGTTEEITVTNGNGVSGDPTLSLPTALTFTGKTVTGGTFAGVTVNASSTIDATVIGGSTAAAGTFTTLAATTSVTTPSVTNAGTLALSATSTNVITMSTNGSERVRVNSAGAVQIGTTAAQIGGSELVTILSAGSGQFGLAVKTANDGVPLGLWQPGDNSSARTVISAYGRSGASLNAVFRWTTGDAFDLVSSGANISLTPGTSQYLILNNIPTSSAGLPTGAVWANAGVLTLAA